MHNKLFLFIILLAALKAEAQTSALAIADSLYAVGSYNKAVQTLQKINLKSEAVFLRLAKNQQESGKWDNAMASYQKVLKHNPNRVLTAVDYGQLLVKAGEFQKADSLFSNLEKTYPQNANFKYQLGLIKEEEKDSTFLKYYKEAVKLNFGHQGALYKLAKNALKNAKFDLAAAYCFRGLAENNKNSGLLSLLAQTFFNEKLYFLAEKPFKKLIALHKGSEYVHSSLGFCYYQMQQFKKAVEQYEMALQYEDHNSQTHFILGKLYVHLGDLKKSEEHLLISILIKNQPVDAEFLSLALTYKLQEDYKRMLEYTQKALEENPDNERALYEKAIAADNYFKDLETRKNYYENYVNKFRETGNEDMLYLAKKRIKDISEEIHLSK